MEFSWKRIGKIIFVVVLAGAVVGGSYFFVTSRRGKIFLANLLYDNRENYLACEDLPFKVQVDKVLKEHADIVSQITHINILGVSAEEIRCRILDNGAEYIKGDVLIEYSSRKQRQEIEKIIGDNFFGIPWRGQQLTLTTNN